jgi:hypothetical protein
MVLAGAACILCCLAVPVWAQNEVLQRKTLKTGKAGHEMTLGGHVRIDRNCLSIGVPRIDLEQPPAHGIMCLRPADVPLQYLVGNAPSNCLGRKAAGFASFTVHMTAIRARTRLDTPFDSRAAKSTLTLI